MTPTQQLAGYLPQDPEDDGGVGVLAADIRAVIDERNRYREHSQLLNKVAWRLAQALGDIPEGAERHEGDDIETLLERTVAALANAETLGWQVSYLHNLAALTDRLPNGCQVSITVPAHVAFPADVTIERDRMRSALATTGEWLAEDDEDQEALDKVTDVVMRTIAVSVNEQHRPAHARGPLAAEASS